MPNAPRIPRPELPNTSEAIPRSGEGQQGHDSVHSPGHGMHDTMPACPHVRTVESSPEEHDEVKSLARLPFHADPYRALGRHRSRHDLSGMAAGQSGSRLMPEGKLSVPV